MYLCFTHSHFAACTSGLPSFLNPKGNQRWKYAYISDGVSRGATWCPVVATPGGLGGTQIHACYRPLSRLSVEARRIGERIMVDDFEARK